MLKIPVSATSRGGYVFANGITKIHGVGRHCDHLHHAASLTTTSLNSKPQSQQASTSKHPLVLCNHGFPSISDNVSRGLSSQLSGSLSSVTCGHCSVLGRRFTHHSSHHSHLLKGYNSLTSTCPQDTNWIVLRSFHSSSPFLKDESVIEKTVKVLKDQAKPKTETGKTETAEGDAAKATTTTPTTTPAKPEKTAETTTAAAAAAAPTTEQKVEPTPAKVEEKPKVAEVPAAAEAEPPKVETKPAAAAPAAPAVKKTITQKVVDVLKHYYHGFRLLFLDVGVCSRYVWRVLKGKTLTRRERRQLVRTAADLFRMVPFLVFIVVPFMEFLLPVALKLFPNMLPSTFAEKDKEQEKLRTKLKVKLEMAKFLQDTIEESSLQKKGASGQAVAEFVQFMEKIRQSGQQTTVEEIGKFSQVFEDNITLDTMTHKQLMAICRLLEIPLPNLGTTNFLRFQLRMCLRNLEADDKMIMKEGIDSLTVWELQEACRVRGMRALGVPKDRLRNQLSQWLTLHQDVKIPTSLLLLSRALYLPESLSAEEQIKTTIAELPSSAADEAKVKISEVTADRVDHKAKRDVIKQEEEAIKKEKEAQKMAEAIYHQAKAELEEKRKKQEEEKRKRLVEENERVMLELQQVADAREMLKEAVQQVKPAPVDSATPPIPQEEILVDKATVLEDKMEEKLTKTIEAEASEEEEEISKEDLEQVEDILEHVAQEREQMKLEKQELEALKEDVEEYKEAVSELKEVVVATGGDADDIKESKAAQRLSSQVEKMMKEMDDVLDKLNKEKQGLMEDIEVKEVRIKRSTELAEDEDAREKVLEAITQQKEDLVSINELMLSMRRIQKIPDDTKIQQILHVLDTDEDGIIDVSDALKVIETLGTENVKLNSKQVKEITGLLKKEDQLLKEEKETKKKEKLEKQQDSEKDLSTPPEQEVLKDTVAKDIGKDDHKQ